MENNAAARGKVKKFRPCGVDILSRHGERMQRHGQGEPVFNDGFPFAIPSCATKGACGPPLDPLEFLYPSLTLRTKSRPQETKIRTVPSTSVTLSARQVCLRRGRLLRGDTIGVSPLNCALSFSTSFCTSRKKWNVYMSCRCKQKGARPMENRSAMP